MKNISEIIPIALDKARHEREEKNTLDPICVQLVDKIFFKLALLCRGFDSFYADRNRLNAEKNQWISAFTKLGLRNQSQIQAALNKLEFHKFPNPPQLGEFLEWRNSRPEDIGFPSVDEAYQISILINRKFSDYAHKDERVEKVIKHAINQIDSMAYRSMPIIKAKAAFEHYYAVSIRQFMDGKFENINLALEDRAKETQEIKRQEDTVLPQYKGIKGRDEAMKAMRGMGIAINARL